MTYQHRTTKDYKCVSLVLAALASSKMQSHASLQTLMHVAATANQVYFEHLQQLLHLHMATTRMHRVVACSHKCDNQGAAAVCREHSTRLASGISLG